MPPMPVLRAAREESPSLGRRRGPHDTARELLGPPVASAVCDAWFQFRVSNFCYHEIRKLKPYTYINPEYEMWET